MRTPFIKKAGLVASATLFNILLIGCTPKTEAIQEKETTTETAPTKEATGAEYIQIIEAVLAEELNGPDEEYIQLAEDAMGGTNETNSVEQKENEMKLMSYIGKRYQPYFTKDGLHQFVMTGLKMYHVYPNAAYKIKLVDSEVTQSDIETSSNQYHILASVELTSPGEEPSIHELEGLAIISTSEGKIGSFVLTQKDPTLRDKINELNEE